MAEYILHGTKDPDVFYGAVVTYDDGDIDGFGRYEYLIRRPDGELTDLAKNILAGRDDIRGYLHRSAYSEFPLIRRRVPDGDAEFLERLKFEGDE